MSYGGVTARLTLGSSVVVTNGQPVELSGPVYMDGEGRIMAPGDFIYKCILLLSDCVDWNVPREERVFMIYP